MVGVIWVKRNKIFLIVGSFFVAVLVFLGIRNTYSATDGRYMITFNRFERNEILQICYTGAEGKLDRSTCYGATSVNFDKLCREWQSGRNKITSNEILNLTITNDMDLHCVAGKSYLNWTYVPKCFKCGEKYFWQIGGGGDATPNHPEYGFPRTNVDSKTCVVVADITEKDKCKVTPPGNACYICDGKYTWTNNPGSSCQKQDNITSESYCKAPEVKKDSCYVCDGEFYWTDNAPSNNCVLKEEIKDIANCRIVNPQTGSIAIFMVWVIALGALVYSFFYFKQSRFE